MQAGTVVGERSIRWTVVTLFDEAISPSPVFGGGVAVIRVRVSLFEGTADMTPTGRHVAFDPKRTFSLTAVASSVSNSGLFSPGDDWRVVVEMLLATRTKLDLAHAGNQRGHVVAHHGLVSRGRTTEL